MADTLKFQWNCPKCGGNVAAKNLKDMDITVGTAHRFQGDEKDVIIFSPVVAQGLESRTLNWIHTTTQLLNVAGVVGEIKRIC